MSTSRREGSGLHQTGVPGSSSYASTRTLRHIATQGLGEPGAVARELARIQRESPERPEPRVFGLEDVTRGLGLSQDQIQRLDAVIGTRVAFVPRSGEQRLPRVRAWLTDVMRSMDLDGATRMEIGRRAMVYWRKFSMPDHQQEPRRRVGKSQIHVLLKGKKVEEKDDDEGKAEGKKKDEAKFDVKDHPEGGHKIHLHDDVHVDLPEDADYQHHATEYAKHSVGYQVHKDKEEDRAEAHRHAANLHAKLANAMISGGKDFRGQEPEEPEELEIQGGAESPGQDIRGKPLPGAPDKKRNEPGRDSQIEAKRRVAGKDPNGRDNGIQKSGFRHGAFTFARGEARYSEAARTFVIPLEKAGPYVGPKGGKWADPQHTIPWSDASDRKLWAKQKVAAIRAKPGDALKIGGKNYLVTRGWSKFGGSGRIALSGKGNKTHMLIFNDKKKNIRLIEAGSSVSRAKSVKPETLSFPDAGKSSSSWRDKPYHTLTAEERAHALAFADDLEDRSRIFPKD